MNGLPMSQAQKDAALETIRQIERRGEAAWVIPAGAMVDEVIGEWWGAIGGTDKPFAYIDIRPAADGSAFLRIPSSHSYWERFST